MRKGIVLDKSNVFCKDDFILDLKWIYFEKENLSWYTLLDRKNEIYVEFLSEAERDTYINENYELFG